METYREMRTRHQAAFNNFPCFFAFSDKQFEEGMTKIGAASEAELYATGSGMFYRKTDAPRLHELIETNQKELHDALYGNTDFLYEAVRYELANHEFCITGHWGEALEALGLTYQEIRGNARLWPVCRQAATDYLDTFDNE